MSPNKQEIKTAFSEILHFVGKNFLEACEDLGTIGIFGIQTLKTSFTGIDVKKVIEQMYYIGVQSLNVVALTGISIGAVLAKHSYDGMHKFGVQDQFIGPLVYISMTREFGPIVSAIMLTARSGSAMAAELGSMKISEQIDALKTLSIDPFRYLIAPRVIGATVIMPFLSLFCTVFGVSAGYLIAVIVLGIGPESYADSITKMLEFSDISYGLVKAAVFGFIAAIVCCYKGINTSGGSRGVGTSTTQAVVYSCVTIFFANYILTSLLFSPK
jgi:phospholipid/cholesterol/gamma-HCH transport system permease protein